MPMLWRGCLLSVFIWTLRALNPWAHDQEKNKLSDLLFMWISVCLHSPWKLTGCFLRDVAEGYSLRPHSRSGGSGGGVAGYTLTSPGTTLPLWGFPPPSIISIMELVLQRQSGQLNMTRETKCTQLSWLRFHASNGWVVYVECYCVVEMWSWNPLKLGHFVPLLPKKNIRSKSCHCFRGPLYVEGLHSYKRRGVRTRMGCILS